MVVVCVKAVAVKNMFWMCFGMGDCMGGRALWELE